MNVSLDIREDVRTRGPLVVDVLVRAVPTPIAAQLTLPLTSTDGLSKCDRCGKMIMEAAIVHNKLIMQIVFMYYS